MVGEGDRAMSVREGFDAEQEKRCRERQLIVLGAALANKEVRTKIRSDEFADARIGSAVGELSGAFGCRTGLRCLLSDLGVNEWDEQDGSPLDLLIEHVRLDGRLALVWRGIAYAIDNTNSVRALSAREKSEALENAAKVVDESHRLIQAAREAASPPKQKAKP